MPLLDEIVEGRTELVFEYLAEGYAANSTDKAGVSLVQWCAYYGDVSAIKFLLANAATLESLGGDLGLIAACSHGHWRLCKFLIEKGADVNRPEADTGETPLHAALCKTDRLRYNLVMKVLLAHGANVNCARKRPRRPADSCATAERRARRRCTESAVKNWVSAAEAKIILSVEHFQLLQGSVERESGAIGKQWR